MPSYLGSLMLRSMTEPIGRINAGKVEPVAAYAFLETAIGIGNLVGGFTIGLIGARLAKGKSVIGGYVVRYEPELASKGEQWLWVSENEAEALGFEDAEKLHEFYAQSIGTRPWDGQPDRPISAYHLAITRVDAEEAL